MNKTKKEFQEQYDITVNSFNKWIKQNEPKDEKLKKTFVAALVDESLSLEASDSFCSGIVSQEAWNNVTKFYFESDKGEAT